MLELLFENMHSKRKHLAVLGSFIPVLGMKLKRGLYVFWSFFKIDLCSATWMGSSHWNLFNDIAERRAILKNVQNTFYPRFSFIPKIGIASYKMGVLFLFCVNLRKLGSVKGMVR